MGEDLYDSKLSEIATSYGGFGLLIVAFLGILYQFTQSQEQSPASSATPASRFILFLLVVYLIVVMPLSTSADRMSYLASYTGVYTWNDFGDYRDAGFGLYTGLVGRLFRWHVFPYFASITAIYVGGIVFFAKKLASPAYVFPFCLSSFINFGFWAYGVNTIRAGMALSLFLIGCAIFISGPKRWKKGVLIAVVATVFFVALSIHITIIVSLAAVLLGYFFHRPRLFILGWLGCLVLSLLMGETIQAYIGGFFEDAEDTRAVGYLTGESRNYRMGFRWDFLAYSCIPIAVGFFYLIFFKVKDRLYDIAICTYLAANGFWLLVIRISYSDRVAFLSWFLFPVILLLPLVRNRITPPGVPALAQVGDVPGKNNKIVLTLFGQLAFMLFMAFVYGAFKQT